MYQFDIADIDKHFYKSEYREGQREAIEFTLNAFNSGKKVVMLECPTGSGKSVIGMTLADMVYNAFYLTSSKVLQDQLTKDFAGEIVELKGKNAYPCTYYQRFGPKMVQSQLITQAELTATLAKGQDCATGYCKTKAAKAAKTNKKQNCGGCFVNNSNSFITSLPPGMEYSACPYFEQVNIALNSRKVVMNFSSFLYQTSYAKRFVRPKSEPRNMMIIDECHGQEGHLLDFVSCSIDDKILKKYNRVLPELDTPDDYLSWFMEVDYRAMLMKEIAKARDSDDLKLSEELEQAVSKFTLFEDNLHKTEWVSEFSVENNVRKVTLKPIFIDKFAGDLLFQHADLIVMMSATILNVDVMCKSLGLDRSHVAAYRMKCRFPVKNRPIYLKTVAKMTGGKSRMHEWIGPLVDGVNELTNKYKGQRGIIHTHTHAITKQLLENCDDDVRSRFVHQYKYPNKDDMLRVHAKKPDSIILAPAMHEGIDLRDDLSRFQIICKVPYANMHDDKQLARRVEVDPYLYDWMTAIKLVQCYGRSVRSDSDYADTYILDSSIFRFLDQAKRMMPDWFTEAIIR